MEKYLKQIILKVVSLNNGWIGEIKFDDLAMQEPSSLRLDHFADGKLKNLNTEKLLKELKIEVIQILNYAIKIFPTSCDNYFNIKRESLP